MADLAQRYHSLALAPRSGSDLNGCDERPGTYVDQSRLNRVGRVGCNEQQAGGGSLVAGRTRALRRLYNKVVGQVMETKAGQK